MIFELELRHFEWDGHQQSLYVPNQEQVRHLYQQNTTAPFPYWARLWPAAIAMGRWLVENRSLLRNKKVLELAAGLALPSLIAAHYAGEVCCSDYLPEPLAVVARSIAHHQLTSIQCQLLNWHHLPADIETDILLLSDVNYHSSEFDALMRVIMHFLHKGTRIVLTTPQRLAAKPFIEKLLPFCTTQKEMAIDHDGSITIISLLQLGEEKTV
ncbi:Predicted nicotinamide N-methyase [Hydrobacter penzbergensis]|uniref:Predicted nicotinamide N-methyase n=1 Tax=Hydrobacter penzbergensis TaxID=1235997 RepID=A0A8X8IEH7_9BACT|nr:methyltransferase [Hydrobacter penzbergensis]SDW68486.1 Predicted nicotinamide N-methyase [Hydrobacter penzbergensis]